MSLCSGLCNGLRKLTHDRELTRKSQMVKASCTNKQVLGLIPGLVEIFASWSFNNVYFIQCILYNITIEALLSLETVLDIIVWNMLFRFSIDFEQPGMSCWRNMEKSQDRERLKLINSWSIFPFFIIKLY